MYIKRLIPKLQREIKGKNTKKVPKSFGKCIRKVPEEYQKSIRKVMWNY